MVERTEPPGNCLAPSGSKVSSPSTPTHAPPDPAPGAPETPLPHALSVEQPVIASGNRGVPPWFDDETANKPLSLLGRYLGSESAAEAERQQICRRQREDQLRYRAAGVCAERADESRPIASRRLTQAEVAWLATALTTSPQLFRRVITEILGSNLRTIVREELERVLVEELPAAVEVLVDRALSSRNGQTRRVVDGTSRPVS